MDTESTYEWVIFKIDRNEKTIDEFDNETLFTNIYLFYCFCRYLSPYYKWKKELKENIILKWPKETFGNVFVFIELLSNLIFKRIFKKGKCIR